LLRAEARAGLGHVALEALALLQAEARAGLGDVALEALGVAAR